MKKRLFALAALTACLGFTGCAARYADVPTPTRFANEEQQKLQAARHWQLIADHFASQILGSLDGKLNGRALHVPQPGGEQAFVEGFRELLISALVAQGAPVALDPKGALVADVRYNIYAFQPERAAQTHFYGKATLLTAGLWAIGGVVGAPGASATGVNVGSKLLATVAGVEGFAWLSNEAMGGGRLASGPVPQSEILLTVSVADGSRIAGRHSSIYYTADQDVGLYWKKQSAGNVVSVIGDCGQGGSKCAR
ncbi:hypothetical protein [Azonexus sp.]|uniref:hypothetical protein n=1 Tax=Azonexus sp. TaxID=1872668 RepID=UPI0039E52F84